MKLTKLYREEGCGCLGDGNQDNRMDGWNAG